jgi:hypothetical protein
VLGRLVGWTVKTRSRPAWLQVLATLILTGCASGIGMALGIGTHTNRSPVMGALAGALAAPVVLVVGVGFWRSGKNSAWWFLVVSVVTYAGVGLLAGAFLHESRPVAIPIMVLWPLIYPVAGFVWGGLLHQAASQGYLPLLGRRAEVD